MKIWSDCINLLDCSYIGLLIRELDENTATKDRADLFELGLLALCKDCKVFEKGLDVRRQ